MPTATRKSRAKKTEEPAVEEDTLQPTEATEEASPEAVTDQPEEQPWDAGYPETTTDPGEVQPDPTVNEEQPPDEPQQEPPAAKPKKGKLLKAEEQPVEEPIDHEKLLNCKVFSLTEIEDKGNRNYRIGFSADTINAKTEAYFDPDSIQDTDFEKALKKLVNEAMEKCFPGVQPIYFKKFKITTKNNKNKETQTYFQIHANCQIGFGAHLISESVQLSGLGNKLNALLTQFSTIAKTEIEKMKPEEIQGVLFEGMDSNYDDE